VRKIAASAANINYCILLHAFSHILPLPAARAGTKTLKRKKIVKKVRTASLNSKFTGSYKKVNNTRSLCVGVHYFIVLAIFAFLCLLFLILLFEKIFCLKCVLLGGEQEYKDFYQKSNLISFQRILSYQHKL